MLTIGATGVAIFAVMCIAGSNHRGYLLDERSWVILAAGLLHAAAVIPFMADAVKTAHFISRVGRVGRVGLDRRFGIGLQVLVTDLDDASSR